MEIAPPRPRFTRQHQKEKSSLLFGFARDRFFLKWKGHFSFWCSALQVFGQCGGAKCGADEAKQNYFCGRKRICFASALFSKRRDLVSAAQEGARRIPFWVFWRGVKSNRFSHEYFFQNIAFQNAVCCIFYHHFAFIQNISAVSDFK